MKLNFTDQTIQDIVIDVNKLEGKIPTHLVDSLFSIHNSLFPDTKEFNKGCSICRRRTFERVQTYYNKNII
jgi:hypothetical protein